MLRGLRSRLRPTTLQALAPEFGRVARIGFWMQVVLGVIPILLLLYTLVSGSGGSAMAQRKGIDLGGYLSFGSLLVLPGLLSSWRPKSFALMV